MVEGVDYVLESGLMVFTAGYLLRRGYCCRNGCRNCPWDHEGPRLVRPELRAVPAQQEDASSGDRP
ncbi:MAG: DUF5522 domain-containing protein [Candidatus Sericytochromatia bacterium]|nr:DUF5522 domain-containing protein [Candidatus Sericytochromatia bacterium]